MARALFALAGYLKMTVRELCGRMGADELQGWLILEGIEPWSRRREDIHFGRALEYGLLPHIKADDRPEPGSLIADWWGTNPKPKSSIERFLERLSQRAKDYKKDKEGDK